MEDDAREEGALRVDIPPSHRNSSPATSPHHSSASSPQPHIAHALALSSVAESKPHFLILQQLLLSDKGHQQEASRHKKRVRRLSKEMYQIVSIYALLQGALFTAVAQTTIFTCADWWGPAFIAGVVTVGTMRGVVDKLWCIGQCKQEAWRFQRRQNAVNDQIQRLYFFGSVCSLDSLEPVHDWVPDPSPGPHCIFSLHGVLVLLFLLGFSCLIITSCIQMLCISCTCQPE